MLNAKLKYVMYDSVRKDLAKSLVIKVVQNNVSVSLFMAAVKYVPLTTIAMAENCTPFLVLILAFFTLNERTSFLAFTATVVAVIGASMVVINTTEKNPEEEIDSTASGGIVLQ